MRSAYLPPIMVKPISRSRLLTSWKYESRAPPYLPPMPSCRRPVINLCARAQAARHSMVGDNTPGVEWHTSDIAPSHRLGHCRCGVEGSTDRGFSCNLTRHLDGSLKWPRDARILRELIDVAVRRTEVHPGITAFVLFSKENFNPV
jgi:hypothetical protein